MSEKSSKSDRIRVAHIEDNPDNRLLIQLLLEDYCDLDSYESGREGLEGLQESRPDVLLLDISLPEMGGLDVLNHIRSHPRLRDLPVIALTAHAMRGDREEYLKAGFDEYLTKPIVDEGLLLAAIQRLASGE